VADLLDEARWEMELLLRMQVPEGQPTAGMVHHKVHDTAWTTMGLAPGDSKAERTLRPVSTAPKPPTGAVCSAQVVGEPTQDVGARLRVTSF
jgi:endoglucanase